MHNLIYVLLLVGAIILIFAAIMAVRAHLENRRGNAAPFRNYFGSEYERDLLRHSALSEAEDWPEYHRIRFAPTRLRDPETINRLIDVSGTAQRNREQD